MKFTYEKTARSDDDVVAYIDEDGDLRVNDKDSGKSVCLCRNGFVDLRIRWLPQDAVHKFYPGDKITLEF